MKKFFILAITCIMTCMACEKAGYENTELFRLTTPATNHVGYEGGKRSVGYEINKVVKGATLTATCEESWISEITYTDAFINFSVERNEEKKERSATIFITYGSQSESVFIIQEANGDNYNVEFKATTFGGEYYGIMNTDYYNYFVQVTDGEINEKNDTPNATYYYFDIYSTVKGGQPAVLPNGTYTLDTNNSNAPGTFSADYSKVEVNNDSGTPVSTTTFGVATITVTDNNFDAVLYAMDGTVHHVVYNGALELANMVPDNSPYSRLTEDYTYNYDQAQLRCFYYGDEYGLGGSSWSVDTMLIGEPVNGDYFKCCIITDTVSDDIDSIVGTYTLTTTDNKAKGTMIAGTMEGLKYFESWYYVLVDNQIVHTLGGPLTEGSLTIEKKDGGYLLTLDCKCDKGYKIQGTTWCQYTEFYDRQ